MPDPKDSDYSLDDLEAFAGSESIAIPRPDDGPGVEELDVFAGGGSVSLPVHEIPTLVNEALVDIPTMPPDMAVTLSRSSASPPIDDPPVEGTPPELVGHPRYRIVRLLGSGGMGSVFQAEHRQMDRPVALKVLRHELTASPAASERFAREVRTAAKLHHPTIVTAFDADRAGELSFLVMEFVEGQSLSDYVKQRGPLPPHEAANYIRQAALGLQYAHDKGMVHRDIKPDNLMRTPEGQIKILDFGIARFAQRQAEASHQGDAPSEVPGASLTLAGSLMGTPDYMAPEQGHDSSAVDIRADIYSLGCTLYYLLTGQVPYPGGTVMQKVMAHLERTPTPIRELRPKVPAELAAVVEKMMARSPADRYQTPGEVALALEPLCTATPRGSQLWTSVAFVGTALALVLGALWLSRYTEPYGVGRGTLMFLAIASLGLIPVVAWWRRKAESTLRPPDRAAPPSARR